MAENFYTMLTKIGKSKLSNSAVSGSKVNFKTLKVGDGKGAYYEPSENQTSLVKEVWSGNISSILVDDANSNWIVVETVIPAADGGFFIREAGIFDEAGDMIAISKLAETYKPVVSEGSTKDLVIKIVLEVLNVDSVTLKIDPNVVAATKNDVQILDSKIQEINSQVSELENSISNKNIITPAVNYGMNNVIKLTGENSVSPKFTIQGRTVINLLGKDGNCEEVSKWLTNTKVTVSLDSNNKVFGTNGFKLSSTAVNAQCFCYKIFANQVDKTKYYCMSAYIKNYNIDTELGIQLSDGVSYVTKTCSDLTNKSSFSRVFVKYDASLANSSSTYLEADLTIKGTTIGQYAYFDGIMVEEITQSQYNDTNFQPSPYVDSYACLQNPYIEVRHDNLVKNGNGEEGVSWWTPYNSATPLTISNGKFSITNIPQWTGYYQKIKVKPNTNYYFSGNSTGIIAIYTPDNSSAITTNPAINGSFNSGNLTEVSILLQNYNSTPLSCTFDSIMLTEGTTAPTAYKPCRIERVVLETKLTSDDSITYDNGEVTGQIWWKHKTLFGKDYDWQLWTGYTGYKAIALANSSSGFGVASSGSNDNIKMQKYDGKIIPWNGTVAYAYDTLYFNTTIGGTLIPSVANTDTGWQETLNPNADEVKAFMNGWRALISWSGRYAMWVSLVDGSYPSLTPQTTVTTASSGTSNNIVVADASKFVVGDSIVTYHPISDPVYRYYIISGISGNTITVTAQITTYINHQIVRCDNGSSDTRILNYCKNNIAPNYEGYQLHYKLATPEPITDVNCHIHGDIPKLDTGDNYLYLDSGIVLGEVASIQLNGDAYINGTGLPLKYKTEKITSVYRNNIDNTQYWISGFDATWKLIGNEYKRQLISIYDASATYTVDYQILKTIAPQIGSIGCSYTQDIVTAINKLSEEVNNRQARDSILNEIVDLSIYEIQNVSYYLAPWIYNGTYLWIEVVVPFAIKKVTPVINLNSLKIDSTTADLTSKFLVNNISWDGNRVRVKYCTTDINTISIVRNNGAQFTCTITADCRRR